MRNKIPDDILKIAGESIDSSYWNQDGYEFKYLEFRDWVIINKEVNNMQERVICLKQVVITGIV
jgi:hypothetical protein